jgi:hypothetical protein
MSAQRSPRAQLRGVSPGTLRLMNPTTARQLEQSLARKKTQPVKPGGKAAAPQPAPPDFARSQVTRRSPPNGAEYRKVNSTKPDAAGTKRKTTSSPQEIMRVVRQRPPPTGNDEDLPSWARKPLEKTPKASTSRAGSQPDPPPREGRDCAFLGLPPYTKAAKPAPKPPAPKPPTPPAPRPRRSTPPTPPTPPQPTTPPIQTTNRFSPLAGLSDSGDSEVAEDEVEEELNPDADNGEPEIPFTKVQSRPPPIILRGIECLIVLARQLKEICKSEFEFVSRRDSTKLVVKDVADYRAATKFLHESGNQFHTFVLKEDKPQKVVLRGIDASVPAEYVKEALLTDYNITVDKVARLTSRRPGIDGATSQEPRGLPLFVVYTMSKETAQAIRKVTKLCYSKVSVENYQSPSGPVQCYRCQRFGHTSKFCASRPQCMKCAKDHPTHECKKPKTTTGRCSNCNGDHVASYRGCPAYQLARDRQAPKQQQRPAQHTPRYEPAPPPRRNVWQARRNQGNQEVPTPQTQRPRAQADQQPPSQDVPLLNIEGMRTWAQTLLDALNKAKSSDRLAVILAHAMPLAMVNAMFSQNASTTK